MSVVVTRSEFTYAKGDTKCSNCGGHLRPPYMEWHGHVYMFFCGPCCSRIKAGVTADLIHCTAVMDIQKAYDGDTVLVRRGIKLLELEAKIASQQIEESMKR